MKNKIKAIWQIITGTAPTNIITENKINRVELIDHTKLAKKQERAGIYYSERNVKVELSVQDEGRTLKIFVT